MTLHITKKHIQRELKILLVAYLTANLINGLSIMLYKTSWNELWTAQKYVLILTEWIYLLILLFRLIRYAFVRFGRSR